MALITMQHDDSVSTTYPTYTCTTPNDATVEGCIVTKKGNVAQIQVNVKAKKDLAVGSTITLTSNSTVPPSTLNISLGGYSGSAYLEGLLLTNGNINLRILGATWYNTYSATITGTYICA